MKNFLEWVRAALVGEHILTCIQYVSCTSPCPVDMVVISCALEPQPDIRVFTRLFNINRGACVGGCPGDTINPSHFTNKQILAQMEGALV
ncbi:hypothetical protein ACFLUZ_06960 [Chloroflexota bacterium]